jgi:hypothetical protein
MRMRYPLIAFSVVWLVAGTWTSHRAREREVENYERTVVYLCVHWADGLPLMPRQSPEKCHRKHVVGNPVRQRFVESGWAEDVTTATLSLAGILMAGAAAWLFFRWCRSARSEPLENG